MEVQKEAFAGLIEYYKKLPLQKKRSEVISEIEDMISKYSDICTSLGIVPDMTLNKEMLNINGQDVTEEDFLHALYAYLNALEDISAQFIDTVSMILIKEKNKGL